MFLRVHSEKKYQDKEFVGNLFDKVTGVQATRMKENIMFNNRCMFALRSSLLGRQRIKTHIGNNFKVGQ